MSWEASKWRSVWNGTPFTYQVDHLVGRQISSHVKSDIEPAFEMQTPRHATLKANQTHWPVKFHDQPPPGLISVRDGPLTFRKEYGTAFTELKYIAKRTWYEIGGFEHEFDEETKDLPSYADEVVYDRLWRNKMINETINYNPFSTTHNQTPLYDCINQLLVRCADVACAKEFCSDPDEKAMVVLPLNNKDPRVGQPDHGVPDVSRIRL